MLPVLVIGLFIGFVGALLGIGGGFILVPALVYLLRVPGNVVIGTSLLQVVAMMAATTILYAVQSQSVDILLAFCLMVGGMVGAQFGASAGKYLRGEQLRALLALLVLAVAIRFGFTLIVGPADPFSMAVIVGRRAVRRLAPLLPPCPAGLAPLPAQAEQLVSTGLQRPRWRSPRASSARQLTLFGNIEPEAGATRQFVEGPFHVVVVVTGPLQDRVARLKTSSSSASGSTPSRWCSSDFPSFYQVLASGKLADITDQRTLDELNILPEAQTRLAASAGQGGRGAVRPRAGAADDRQGLFRRQRAGRRSSAPTRSTRRR